MSIVAFQKLGRVEEISPGRTKYVHHDREPVILANWRGEIYALCGFCGHQKLSLEGAWLWDYLLDCPWHHFQYDVRSGENHYPKNVYPADEPHLQMQTQPLKTYPVEVREGEIWVDLE
jgi:3-phenylpropionate/trans-cinnamate dioxygenase ferredoxin subunit